jgi:quinolinate synthase
MIRTQTVEEAFSLNVPERILALTEAEATERIRALKRRLGSSLVILGHHYQRREIVELADYRGDSLQLARLAAEQRQAKYIVFCGVNFMAETAAILAQPHQKVIHPNFLAGCPLADLADEADVLRAWQEICAACDLPAVRHGAATVIPITYVNSSAAVKAFCGRNRGIICTSANAKAVARWALARGERFLFMPDEHLGRNTCNALGIPRDKTITWDPKSRFGGHARQEISRATAILWKGNCHVHTFFTPDHVRQARQRYPDAKIIVHPECTEKVVALADASGSTSAIVRYVEEAPAGATIIIGTEINLVSRLAREHPEKHVYPLARSLCPNMYRINLHNLLFCLGEIGKVNVVRVPEEIRRPARRAIQRMLKLK